MLVLEFMNKVFLSLEGVKIVFFDNFFMINFVGKDWIVDKNFLVKVGSLFFFLEKLIWWFWYFNKLCLIWFNWLGSCDFIGLVKLLKFLMELERLWIWEFYLFCRLLFFKVNVLLINNWWNGRLWGSLLISLLIFLVRVFFFLL